MENLAAGGFLYVYALSGVVVVAAVHVVGEAHLQWTVYSPLALHIVHVQTLPLLLPARHQALYIQLVQLLLYAITYSWLVLL